jgi:hypothetical protein
MKRLANILAVVALVLIGLAAWLVGSMASRQALDRPGVKLSAVPLIGEDGRLARSNTVALPTQLEDYRYEARPFSDGELNSLPRDTVFGRARYHPVNGDPFIQLSVVLMGTDRTSIHRPEYCLTGAGWKVLKQTDTPVVESGPGPRRVQRFDCRIRTESEGRPVELSGVYVFWFISKDKQTSSHWERQWWMVRDLVTRGVLQRWAYVSFFAPCAPGDEEEAYQRVTKLIKATAPYFELSPDVASR